MELTTILIGALIALGVIGTDAALTSGSVFVEVNEPPWTEKTDVDKIAVESQIETILTDVAGTRSVVEPPEITFSRYHGVGMAVAEALEIDKVAFAVQTEFGFAPDQLRVEFYEDDGTIRALLSGVGEKVSTLSEVVTIGKDEPFMAFVRRSALVGVSRIAPYGTAIYLFKEHAGDKDFTEVLSLVERSKAGLPPTPTNLDRSLFDNLLGLVALFKNDLKGAQAAFQTAMADDPANAVAFINASFVDLQMDDYKSAADRMEQLIRLAPPDNKVLLASAYMTWGAALMGLHQLAAADSLFKAAGEAAPMNSTVFGLWAEERRLQGDTAAAGALDRRALENTVTFENYAEVAALYFQLAWQDGRPIEANKFASSGNLTLH